MSENSGEEIKIAIADIKGMTIPVWECPDFEEK